jgi:hypothetical protein
MSLSRPHRGKLDTEVSTGGTEQPVEPAYYKPAVSRAISAHMQVPTEPVTWKMPVVMRGQRRAGARYLDALGAVRQPISFLGSGPDIGIAVHSSAFNPDQVQRHDAGFNDALFEAGYPGFNLGLSFKVAQLSKSLDGPGYAMRMRSPNVRVTISRLGRNTQASGTG